MRLLQRVADQVRLLVGREGDVDDLDLWVLDQRLGRVVDLGDAPALGHFGRAGRRARGDRDHREAGLGVGGEMDVGHDHAGADAADPEIAASDRCVRHEPWGVAHPASLWRLTPLPE